MNYKPVTVWFILCLMIVQIGLVSAQTNTSNSLNQYSFDLYSQMKVEKKNLFISPLSTYYALLMAYEGSKDETKSEFEKALYLGSSNSMKNDFLHDLVGKSDSSFDVSNAIWVDKSLQVNAGYTKNVTNKYLSDFRQTEFANTQTAVNDINQWIAEKTRHRINKIVDNSSVDSTTQILITNAVYFKGMWLNKFEKYKTGSELFSASSENQSLIAFMNITEQLQYFENDEYQFISKPYKSSDMSFCIILPKKQFGIENIEKKMNADFFDNILNNTSLTKTWIIIPKFKLEFSYQLSGALENLGLKSAFSDKANFSGMAKNNNLVLGQVIHKTSIEMDEEKTVAAAATAIDIRIRGISSNKIFKADHPFVFFIIDNQTRAIIFMGRFADPIDGVKCEDNEIISTDKMRTLMNTSVEDLLKGRTPPSNK